VIQISTEFDEEIPRWDVALESLLNEEHHRLGRALQIDDFHHLAAQHAIRFDDIMATLFELVLNGNWRYADHDDPRPLTRDRVNRLYINGRLDPVDVREFRGEWSPNS